MASKKKIPQKIPINYYKSVDRAQAVQWQLWPRQPGDIPWSNLERELLSHQLCKLCHIEQQRWHHNYVVNTINPSRSPFVCFNCW